MTLLFRVATCIIVVAAGLVALTRPAAAAIGEISTFAGGYGDDGTATATILRRPEGVAVDSSGNVFIAETELHQVRKVTPTGTISKVAGTDSYGFSGDGGPATNAKLWAPYGVAVDAAGNLLIADTGNNRIRKVNSAGTITTVAGNGTLGSGGDGGPATSAQFHYPIAFAFDSTGNMFIADDQNHRVRKITAGGIISTVAGTGTAGYTGDGGAATSARVNRPQGVTVDSSGNLFIADAYNHVIRKVATSGTITTIAGTGVYGFSGDGGPATSAKFFYPREVVANGGNLFIADGSNDRIRKVNTAGTISTVAGSGISGGFSGDGGPATSATLLYPHGLAVATSGVIYIADTDNDRIRKVDTLGIITTIAGTSPFCSAAGDGGVAATARICGPRAVTADSVGNVYIADTENERIRKVNAAGVISTVAGTGSPGFSGDGGAATAATLNGPQGLSVDSVGNLYIADKYNHRIRMVTPEGIITSVAGTGAAGSFGDAGAAAAAQLNSPGSVAVDAARNLYIADTGNSRIRRVDAAGTITTVAGTGSAGFSGDGGPAILAQLNRPEGVATDSGANVLVADTSNARIRRINVASGAISTIVGTGTSGFGGDGGPATSASLSSPLSVAVDSGNNLFIADLYNHRVREVVTSTGTITTVAGSSVSGYSGDGGPATSAQLKYPYGVAVDSGGDLYIADEGNDRVRKVDGNPASPPANSPNAVQVSPTAQTRAPGSSATVTAHVVDAANNPVAGATVSFVRSGTHPGSANLVTNGAGDATHSYTGSSNGTDKVDVSIANSSATGTASVVWSSSSANRAPATPVLLTPASEGAANGGPGQLFTVRATDDDGDAYSATVTVKQSAATVRTFVTTPTASAQESTGTPEDPLLPGTYTWSARATDVRGLSSSDSDEQLFTVSLSGSGGGGAVEGDVLFVGSGVPTSRESCGSTNFTFTGVSAAAVVNLAGFEYVGTLSMDGQGSSMCENASAGQGQLTVTNVGGTGTGGDSIACGSMAGTFVRVGPDVEVVVTGTCSVNGVATGKVKFRAGVEFVPTNPGGGITGPITEAAFAGTFTLTPS